MQRPIVRFCATFVGLAAIICGIWFVGAWLGEHMPAWGVLVALVAIFVFFAAELRDHA